MNSVLFLAAVIPVLLGVLLAASVISERRQVTLRQRIGHSIGSLVAQASPQAPRLDTGGDDRAGALGWLPSSLGTRIELALGATGDRITVTHLMLIGAAGALLAFAITGVLLSINPLGVLVVMVTCAIGLPYLVTRFMQTRFETAFLSSFPDALDLIVRSVRAGLPVSDAIETVGHEIDGPVGTEFRRVHEGVVIGMQLEEELQRAAIRIRSIEFRFFIVALALQKRTGGNLAETLENLSVMIRRRKEMWLKARAMMSESRASAWLIGILPFVGGTAIYIINSKYIDMLFFDPRGKILLFTAILLLVGGAFIMRSMIKRSMR